MTYDASDITDMHDAPHNYIQTASGELTEVKGAGTVKISPSLTLSNCLYIPSLSHKLLSISHVTKELSCTLFVFYRISEQGGSLDVALRGTVCTTLMR